MISINAVMYFVNTLLNKGSPLKKPRGHSYHVSAPALRRYPAYSGVLTPQNPVIFLPEQ